LVGISGTLFVYLTLFTDYLITDYYPKELYMNISKEKMPTLDSTIRTPTIPLYRLITSKLAVQSAVQSYYVEKTI